MEGLKRWWFERAVKKNSHNSHYFQDRKEQHIAIITDLEYDNSAIKKLKRYLSASNNKCQQIGYTTLLTEESDGQFGPKQLKWPGIPSGELVDQFLENTYDLCYFVVAQPSYQMEYLLRSTKAALKLGFYHQEYLPYLDYAAQNEGSNDEAKVDFLITSANKLLFS